MARSLLALIVGVSLTGFACGVEQLETESKERGGRPGAPAPASGECSPEWPGPWTACPEADWIRQVAENAGYRITGETGSALIAQGNGWEFYIWATDGTKAEAGEATKRENWQRLGVIDDIVVFGDDRLWRWWVLGKVVVWLQVGPHDRSRVPPLEDMGSLVQASKQAAPPL